MTSATLTHIDEIHDRQDRGEHDDCYCSETEYSLSNATILNQAFIAVPHDDQTRVCQEFVKYCRNHFKSLMLARDFADYPEYLREPFLPLYALVDGSSSDYAFDFDEALVLLDQILEEHIVGGVNGGCDTGIKLIGTEHMHSYLLGEDLLELAMTSGIFNQEVYVMQCNDLETEDNWVYVYTCKDGKPTMVYSNA